MAGTEKKYILELGFPIMNHISCFRSSPGQSGFDITDTGVLHPLSSREFPYHRFVFALNALPGEDQMVYLRLRTINMTIPLTLWSEDAFTRQSHLTLLFAGLFYGALLIMIGYNAFISIALHDRSYLYFTAFLISIFMTHLSYEGFAGQYLWPDVMLFNRFATSLLFGCIQQIDTYSAPVREPRLNAIQSGGRSLLTLINDISDLSKIEAGKMILQLEPVRLHSIFGEIQHIFSLKISQKRIAFISDISDEIPEALLFDEARLRQILFNLVGNAVKFTEKGEIRISAKPHPRPSPERRGSRLSCRTI